MSDRGGVLVRRDGGDWSEPEVAAYENEAHLQQLIAGDPHRVPGVDRDALAVVELPTAAGPIDVSIVGRDGSITVVECKLASSRERRRMVIGQVIDYAAAVWEDGPDAFVAAWHGRGGPDLREELEPEALDRLRRNVAEARIDLCLTVDRIDGEVRRLVEYLNRVTRDDVGVTALELAYARHGDVEILVPSTYGGEIAAAKVRRSERSAERWTWESFLAALRRDEDRALAEELRGRLERLEVRGPHETLWFGAKPRGGIYFHLHGLRYAPFQLWVNGAGDLVAFGNWTRYPQVANHAGFARLARSLDQDHEGPPRSVRLADRDLDELWDAAVECAEAINE
ncbi:MAG: hypothetical protein FWJ72_10865 [Acidimicrobiia bacterium]|nr:hypothetical protein [Thermoanaerobacterales bacterium]